MAVFNSANELKRAHSRSTSGDVATEPLLFNCPAGQFCFPTHSFVSLVGDNVKRNNSVDDFNSSNENDFYPEESTGLTASQWFQPALAITLQHLVF